MIGLYICMYRFLLYSCSEAVFLETLILGKIIFIFRIRYKLVSKHPASCLVIRLQGINVGTITAHYSDLTAGAIRLFLYGKNAAYRNYIIDKILRREQVCLRASGMIRKLRHFSMTLMKLI